MSKIIFKRVFSRLCCIFLLMNVVASVGGVTLSIPKRPQTFPLSLPSISTNNYGVLVWGTNNDNPYNAITIPAKFTNVVQVSSGGNYPLYLKSDGTVDVLLTNWQQAPIPEGIKNVTQVSATDGIYGTQVSLVLKNDGTVVGWGDNTWGQISIPVGLKNVVQILTLGVYFSRYSLALKSDGTVVGWGDNYYGQISIPAGLTNVVQITACNNYALALKSDGTVVGWGDNSSGQISIPSGLTNVVQIAAQRSYALAVGPAILGFSPFDIISYGATNNLRLDAVSSSGFPISYKSSDSNVAVINGTNVTIIGCLLYTSDAADE